MDLGTTYISIIMLEYNNYIILEYFNDSLSFP